MALCPTCHSNIGSGSLGEAARTQGSQGTDSNDLPIPRWSDDPSLTANGLSGAPFKGINRYRNINILELQQRINTTETDLGLPVTSFSPIDHNTHNSRRLLIELREAIEKILNSGGFTLVDYFKLDDDGNEITQNPLLVSQYGAGTPQDEWIDVTRGEPYTDQNGTTITTFMLPDSTVQQTPGVKNDVHLKAVHLEDLRHPIPVGIPALLINGGDQLFHGVKASSASFKKTEPC